PKPALAIACIAGISGYSYVEAQANKRLERTGEKAGCDVYTYVAAGRSAAIRYPSKGISATISFMIDWSTCPAVERDPQRVSGAWVFRGTRVPVAALFENLEDGAQVSQFVQWFPGVSVEQVRAVLEHAARSAL